MKSKLPDLLEKGRVRESDSAMQSPPGEWYGRFIVRHPSGSTLLLMISAGDIETWAMSGFPEPRFEHVSVSVRDLTSPHSLERCPTWEEMAFVKKLCWEPEECVLQYHPPRSEYVNYHPFVLHLWKPIGVDVPRPPMLCIGPPAVQPAAPPRPP